MWQEGPRPELFNLVDDPYERTNLAVTRNETMVLLRKELHFWQRSVGAKFPSRNPNFDPKKPSDRTTKWSEASNRASSSTER
jgi:hypothetical protein